MLPLWCAFRFHGNEVAHYTSEFDQVGSVLMIPSKQTQLDLGPFCTDHQKRHALKAIFLAVKSPRARSHRNWRL
jgi:hypothetical protein